MLLTNMLPQQGNGTYTLHAMAIDIEGLQTWIGTRTFASDNANATKPFGSIETPGRSEIASGNSYLNFGWALTQQPKVIPFDGSTITVVVDDTRFAAGARRCTMRSGLTTAPPKARPNSGAATGG